MYLVLGLGNPEETHAGTRHNAGFLALDAFARKQGFPAFAESKKHRAALSEGSVEGKKVLLAKPSTYMNDSGKAARLLVSHFKLPSRSVIVVHDEIDLPLGYVRVSRARGSAGHKGVESIMNELGSRDFARVRIGIKPGEAKPGNVEEFVLRKFAPGELPLLRSAEEKAGEALLSLLQGND